VSVATNPLRLSYYGKEIVVCRYNFFKKLKRNQLNRVVQAQERTKLADEGKDEGNNFNTDDSYKIAKTLLHQGTLLPLPDIV